MQFLFCAALLWETLIVTASTPPFGAWQCNAWGSELDGPLGLAIGASGSAYVATERGLRVCDSSGQCNDTGLPACEDVAVDAQGTLHLITRHSSDSAQMCSISGECVPIGGNEPWEWPTAVAATEAFVYVSDAYHGLKKCTANNCTKLAMQGYGSHMDLAVGIAGDVFVADDFRSNSIVRCERTGVCNDLAGFEAFGRRKLEPSAIAVGADDTLFLGGVDGWVKRCSASGVCTDVVNSGDHVNGIAVSPSGAIFISAGTSVTRCVVSSQFVAEHDGVVAV